MRIAVVNPAALVAAALILACALTWFAYMCLTDEPGGSTGNPRPGTRLPAGARARRQLRGARRLPVTVITRAWPHAAAACRRARAIAAGGTSWGRAAIALRIHGITIDVTLPNRGDAQEREGGCAPQEPRPAARADLTGLLSPRQVPHWDLNQEGPQAPSAPPPEGTPGVPGRDGKRPDSPPTRREAPVRTTRPDTHLYGGPEHPAGDLTRLATGAERHQAGIPAPWCAPELAPAALSPWEHKTQWFTLDAIDADIQARATAGGET
jgi:hypothetical protein